MFAIPYIFIMIVIVVSGQIADHVRKRKILSTTAVRKIQTIIGNVFIFVKSVIYFIIENRWNWFVTIFSTCRICWL